MTLHKARESEFQGRFATYASSASQQKRLSERVTIGANWVSCAAALPQLMERPVRLLPLDSRISG